MIGNVDSSREKELSDPEAASGDARALPDGREAQPQPTTLGTKTEEGEP